MNKALIAAVRMSAGAGALLLAVAACSASQSSTPTAGSHGTVTAKDPAGPFLNRFRYVSQVASTVPASGDVNPYGVAVVSQSTGNLVSGDILVSNFNDSKNLQGTGTTIMQVTPGGTVRQFSRITSLPTSMACPGGVGLTTALSVLPGGWVIVGSLPTTKSGALPADNPLGCLIVLDSQGKPVETWTSPQINGPWDMTAQATAGRASLFVTNVLSRAATATGAPALAGLCDVTRIDVSLSGSMPKMTGLTVIGTGFPWLQNKAALIQGPTGAALSPDGTLYVASTLGNSISAIPTALTRTTPVNASAHVLTSNGGLNGPLGMTWTPAGDLVAVNGNNGNAVEIAPDGKQIATITLVPGGAGDLFGLTPTPDGRGLLFVNDGTNALDLLSG
jgi:hypothetical protein